MTKVIGGFTTDAEFFKMDYKEFKDYCGGRLSVALFKGTFDSELNFVIQMASARGALNQLKDSSK